MSTGTSTPSVLFLLNGGDFTRHYLLGMLAAATEMGIRCHAVELDPVWEKIQSSVRPQGDEIAELIRSQNVKLVIGSSLNGSWEWPVEEGEGGRIVSFFERLGVPHLMWWTDHPHWANEKIGLRPDFQSLLSVANNCHFVKSEVAAAELNEVLGWRNCHGLPVAEVPEFLEPAKCATPEFDLVAIVGSPPRLDPAILHFLEQDDPNPNDIVRTLASGVVGKLRNIWRQHAPEGLHESLNRFADRWVEARCEHRRKASYHLFKQLEREHQDATQWLRANPRVYFHASEALWDLGHWERAFTLVYLTRFFRVGVFGMDWSSVGLGGSGRVWHAEQPQVYARGRVAINISQGNDEEGVSHKPFQIAACRVAMMHNEVRGLSDCFEPGREVAVFDSPHEARERLAELLADPAKREAMATAARERVCREHTWKQRLPGILAKAGITSFGAQSALQSTITHSAAREGVTSCGDVKGPSNDAIAPLLLAR